MSANINALTRSFNKLAVGFFPKTVTTRKRKQGVSIRRNLNTRSLKKARINTNTPNTPNRGIIKRKEDAIEKAVKAYNEANECLTTAEGILMSASITGHVTAMNTRVPVESSSTIVAATNRPLELLRAKVALLKETTSKAKEEALTAALATTSVESSEVCATKALEEASKAEKLVKIIERAAKVVEKAAKDELQKEIKRITTATSKTARSQRALTRERKGQGFNTLRTD